MISEEHFKGLKEGDRVMTFYSGKATVVKTNAHDAFTKKPMVILKCDSPKWGCPYFYRSEIKEVLNETI